MNVYWSSAMYDLYPLQAKVRFTPKKLQRLTKHIESRYSVIPLNQ